jgi:hypothetical protein
MDLIGGDRKSKEPEIDGALKELIEVDAHLVVQDTYALQRFVKLGLSEDEAKEIAKG